MRFYRIFQVLVIPLNLSCPTKGQISMQKCEEYAKAVYSEKNSPVLLKHAVTNRVSNCGIVSVPLIVGGTEAQPMEFPHMALIGYGDDFWGCGGSLISELYVLTAAHCTNSRDHGPAERVKVGIIQIAAPNDGRQLQEKAIANRITHPDYKPPSKYNDIALLQLDSPVSFNSHVRPACLNAMAEITDITAIATGFGKLSYDATEGSKSLMKVQLNFITNPACSSRFSSRAEKLRLPQGIADSMLCAGETAGGKDTCQGDSGGPLQTVLQHPYCMYSLVGVTSFGKFCGYPNSPAIYTRVSYFVPWIESIVWA